MEYFRWSTFDVRAVLPFDWQEQLIELAEVRHREWTLYPVHCTSREAPGTAGLLSRGVSGSILRAHAPWLIDLYENKFVELAEEHAGVPVTTMSDPRFDCVLNMQKGNDERYECHVDTNPIEGLLYITSHPEGTGGELVMANNLVASTPAEVDDDATIIYPQAGHLVFFDGRNRSHYVRAMKSPGAIRLVAAMNYYTAAAPEAVRPPDLNRHLSGQD